jgi:cysteine synthase A
MDTPIHQSVLELIGHTPVLELNRIKARYNLEGRILAKLELLNPGGSKKDRVALEIIRAGRESGKLSPGQPVVEVTSGNTGTGLAIVCRALGHPFYAVMSAGNTRERAQMMRALGAEVVLVPQAPGGKPGLVTGADMKLVKEKAAQLIKDLNAFFSDQFENPNNAAAHIINTAPELWKQTGGNLDAIVGFVGSGGALGGLAKGLYRFKPDLHAYVVEPAGATSLASCCCSDVGHAIQGGGYGRDKISLLDGVKIDGYIPCTDDQASELARALAIEEGILAGYSTGAQLHAAIQLLRGPEKGKTLALLVCDTGMKYLSTGLYP